MRRREAPRVRADLAGPPRFLLLGACLVLAGCSGPQSSLDPAGEAAERVSELFWQMLTGAAVIWCIVIGASVLASYRGSRTWDDRTAFRVILWGGAVFPTIVLAGLLVHGLRLMPELRAAGGDLRIEVEARQFWWHVTYHAEGRPPIVSANELRMPAGGIVEVVLTSPDVIHSFWIPAIAGKTDAIPGRTTRQMLKPTRPGIYRGACAEFCGSSHALMAMTAEVMTPERFEAWLDEEGGPAKPQASAGEQVFQQAGCGACHTVRGTPANGTVGPDLTHVGSRHAIGAGILPNSPEEIARFVAHADEVKPGIDMPSYRMLPEQDLMALATWLAGLE
jgi:cytochrome c oxidase subunit 2